MGLDTSHNCWHGPYSSFNDFRKALANQIGINLDDYIGYGDKGTKDLESIPHDIMPLLNHSDCDGELSPDECTRIAKGLDDVLSNFKDDAVSKYPYNFKDDIVQFRNGCIDAASKNETVYFH